jgi:branched-chain amino acid transport system permease protein
VLLSTSAAVLRHLARRGWILTTVLLPVVVLAAPSLGLSLSSQRNVELIILLSLVVSGLNLCYGYAGELAMGQVAIYAAGAYIAGYVAINLTHDMLAGIALAAIAGPVIGLITGIPGLRIGGWSLAMLSFFLVLIIPNVVAILGDYTGGAAGLTGIPIASLFGHQMSRRDLYTVMVVAAALWFIVLRNIVVSRRGRAWLVMRQSPVLAAAVGMSVFRTKLIAYMIAAIPAGVAGALLAYSDQYLAPEYFSFSLAVSVLAATVLGGRTSVYGAVLAAAVLQLGPLRAGAFEKYNYVVFGCLLLLGGALLPNGIVGVARSAARRVANKAAAKVGSPQEPVEPEPLRLSGKVLQASGVCKSFGGVRALKNVSLRAEPGKVTSIIGPNGSGKTTMLNLISGFNHPDSGEVSLGEHRIDSRSPHRIAVEGVARTFQTPIVSSEVSALDTVAVGRIALERTNLISVVLRLPRYRRAAQRDVDRARLALTRVGLLGSARMAGSELPLGHRRMLELARVLAAEPSVILLDEVASGVDEETVTELSRLIRELAAAGATVILVEHNFRLVLDISDEIYVLANGELIAHGEPEHVANHPDVLEQYLGTPVPAEEAK